jgi:hypothetical protein
VVVKLDVDCELPHHSMMSTSNATDMATDDATTAASSSAGTKRKDLHDAPAAEVAAANDEVARCRRAVAEAEKLYTADASSGSELAQLKLAVAHDHFGTRAAVRFAIASTATVKSGGSTVERLLVDPVIDARVMFGIVGTAAQLRLV